MYKTAQIITLANLHHIPIILENPCTSMLWEAPPIKKIVQHSRHIAVTCDQCQFGTRWRKRTRFSCWNCNGLQSLDKRCTGAAGCCNKTGKPHIILKGRSPEGPLWTALAQEYPAKLSHALCDVLVESFEGSCLLQAKSICGLRP